MNRSTARPAARPAASLPARFPHTLRPGDCCDWLTAEDVLRHALAAYYFVCRERDAYADEADDGVNLTDKFARRELGEDIGEIFAMRLMDHGYRAGAPGFSQSASLWLANRYDPDPVNISNPLPVLSELSIPNMVHTLDIHCAQCVS